MAPLPRGEPRVGRPADDGMVEVLILDAGMRQALVATRSLGRAGLSVAVADCWSTAGPRFAAPAFSSRWATMRSLIPDFELDPDAYAAAVARIVADHPGMVVVPCSDQSLDSLRPWRDAIGKVGALAAGSEPALAIAVDKVKTLQLAAQLRIPVPPTVVVSTLEEGRDALKEMGYPAVLKPATSWWRERAGDRLLACEVLGDEEAESRLRCLLEAGKPVHVQPWLAGRREAVSLLRADGTVKAAFAQSTLRTTPVLGGASVIRESIALPADLYRAAVDLVDAMDLDGFADVEFRRDDCGRPLLMEVNARLSGSLELAVRCGVDFPRMLWSWASGRPVETVAAYRTGLRMRWLTGDVRWLVETLRRRNRPDSVSTWRALSTFAGSFGHPQAYDFVDLFDPKPAATELARLLSRARRLRGGAPAESACRGESDISRRGDFVGDS